MWAVGVAGGPHWFSRIEVVVSSRRTVILIIALLVGALSAFLIFQYVGSIEEQAQGGTQVVTVVVARSDIAKGAAADAAIDAGAIGTGERRQVDLPANVITRVEDIRGQVAVIDIAPGTIITSAMFASQADLTDSNSNVLSEGMVAVTVSADQVKSVAGLIKPGDYVNVMVEGDCVLGEGGSIGLGQGTASEGGDGSATPEAPGGGGTRCVGQLFQKTRILAIGRSLGTPVAAPDPATGAAPPTTEAPSSDMITFEVPAEQAQYLAAATSIYLALVRPDYEPVPMDPASFPLPLFGAAGETPYGSDPEADGEG